MCSAALKEVATHYVNNGSNVFCLLLDASKAFDRVEYSKLFNALLDRKVNSVYVRCLVYMYSHQKLRVNWKGYISDTFTVKNGVKQGGVISPLLFSVYIDELLHRLQNSNIGCYMGPYYTGSVAYADDLVIMSPSVQGLKKLLKICERYSKDYQLTFNGSKSQFIVFHGGKLKLRNMDIKFCGVQIKSQDKVIHLGHTLYADLRLDDIQGVLAKFYRQFNIFFSRFKEESSVVLAQLFRQ
jgi:hypothetical protein